MDAREIANAIRQGAFSGSELETILDGVVDWCERESERKSRRPEDRQRASAARDFLRPVAVRVGNLR